MSVKIASDRHLLAGAQHLSIECQGSKQLLSHHSSTWTPVVESPWGQLQPLQYQTQLFLEIRLSC